MTVTAIRDYTTSRDVTTPQLLSWTKQVMEGFMSRFKHSIVGKAFTLAMTVVAVSACAMLFAAVAGAATKASPFTAATVSATGTGYKVSWHSDAAKVSVFATHDRAGLTGATKVGSGRASASLTVKGLATGSRWYFRLTTGGGRSVVVGQRFLNVDGVHNFRDFGGCRTANGRWVKEGLLFRSGLWNGITTAGIATVTQLGIKTDIDLRMPSEDAAQPDPAIPGITYIADSIEPDVSSGIPGRAPAAALVEMGYAFGTYQGLYLEFGSYPTCVNGYNLMFHDFLAAAGKPTLIHCTAGDDRTGWGSYLMLRVLGVPPATALSDYLASNVGNKAMLQSEQTYFLGLHAGLTKAQTDFFLKAAYIHAAMTAVNMTYGNFDRFVRLGLGLSKTDVRTLRATYLAS